VGDQRLPVLVDDNTHVRQDSRLDAISVRFDAATLDGLLSRPAETQSTGWRHLVTETKRRTVGTAGDGPRRVEVAGPGRGIEHGTGKRRVTLEERVQSSLVLCQASARRIAGKALGQDLDSVRGTPQDRAGPNGVNLGQLLQSTSQAPHVETGDRKRSVAAVVAAGPALEPRTCLPLRFGEIGVETRKQLSLGPVDTESRHRPRAQPGTTCRLYSVL
jgi:hypothetical protein